MPELSLAQPKVGLLNVNLGDFCLLTEELTMQWFLTEALAVVVISHVGCCEFWSGVVFQEEFL
eukprot:8811975-Ditylum_brightwellii.AAC.1